MHLFRRKKEVSGTAEQGSSSARGTFPSGIQLLHSPEDAVVEYDYPS